ncbi:hypothetical protein [Actibacterium sp. 188UL27-1]|uniref:hypothetical protein n=1 Tax=Actibacterium sp. 188UL27-1 TaxID=2786961 RepID=UPI00195DCC14|nr:hypothetical protein [Actibacterium sp. 188UL27-1]MBM7067038.1 hypothetical protein [Actibacterium sp. 188UL27-1]
MSYFQRIKTAGLAFSLAMATGFVMQHGDLLFGTSAPQTDTAPAALNTADVQPTGAEIILQDVQPLIGVAIPPNATVTADDALLPELVSIPSGPHPKLSYEGVTLPVGSGFQQYSGDFSLTQDERVAGPEESCIADFTASPATASMIYLVLDAPCYPRSIVNLRQGGLRFTVLTDAKGHYEAQIPALEQTTIVSATFDDGWVARAKVEFEEYTQFQRVALQWKGKPVLRMHAFEGDQRRGQAGHIWHRNTGDPKQSFGQGGGFMTVLGDPRLLQGWQVEIYSFPTEDLTVASRVRLNVEAEVTRRNCGRNISAKILQPGFDAGSKPVALTIAMPRCNAVGRVLVMDDVLRDMRVAAR